MRRDPCPSALLCLAEVRRRRTAFGQARASPEPLMERSRFARLPGMGTRARLRLHETCSPGGTPPPLSHSLPGSLPRGRAKHEWCSVPPARMTGGDPGPFLLAGHADGDTEAHRLFLPARFGQVRRGTFIGSPGTAPSGSQRRIPTGPPDADLPCRYGAGDRERLLFSRRARSPKSVFYVPREDLILAAPAPTSGAGTHRPGSPRPGTRRAFRGFPNRATNVRSPAPSDPPDTPS